VRYLALTGMGFHTMATSTTPSLQKFEICSQQYTLCNLQSTHMQAVPEISAWMHAMSDELRHCQDTQNRGRCKKPVV